MFPLLSIRCTADRLFRMGLVDDEQNAARADIRAAVQAIAKARADLDRAIRRGRDAKLSLNEMAQLVGVSRPTVDKLGREDEPN
jgi:hypothetical protein